MAGTPKQNRLLAELQRRAIRELGEGATMLEYVEHYVAGGGLLARLAEDLAVSMGESVSRPFLSNTVHGLAPDASERLKAARRDGAFALVEEAAQIADNAPETTGGTQKAKLQIGTRTWLAERFAPEQFGSAKPAVVVNLGELFLDAFRCRVVRGERGAPALPSVAGAHQETIVEAPEIIGNASEDTISDR